MKQYKLTYFEMRGLGEPIRLLLTDNNIPFEDKRLTKEEDSEWKKQKTKYAFGQLPCLQDDDESIVQTGAILRHLARKHDLYGRTESEHTFADMFYEGLKDLHMKYAMLLYMSTPDSYEDSKKKYVSATLPEALAQLEKLFHTFDNGEHFVLGEKPCFVDYVLFEEIDCHLRLQHDCLSNCPALLAFHSKMNQKPSLQSYLMKRATSDVPINWSGRAN